MDASGEEKQEKLAMFLAFTGVSGTEAAGHLERAGWDVQRAINGLLEGQEASFVRSMGAGGGENAAAAALLQSSAMAGSNGNVIDLEDDENEISNRAAERAGSVHAEESARRKEVITVPDGNEEKERIDIEEMMLKQAMEESMQALSAQQSIGSEDIPTFDGSAHVPQTSGAAGTSADIGIRGQSIMSRTQTKDGKGIQTALSTEGVSQMVPPMEGAESESPRISQNNLLRSASHGSNASGQGDRAMEDIALPDDVNPEEAKMLEAAMFGIPYEGPIPAARDSTAEASPEMTAERMIRREQEQAYQASLRADREKEAEKAAAERRARVEQAEREEHARAERQRAADEAAKGAREMERKRAALGDEPPASEEGTVAVMVRLPDGSRCSRRFSSGDEIELLFYFVDVHGGLAPGSYRLLTQFPRRVLQAGASLSLEQAGLMNKQEALFVEKI